MNATLKQWREEKNQVEEEVDQAEDIEEHPIRKYNFEELLSLRDKFKSAPAGVFLSPDIKLGSSTSNIPNQGHKGKLQGRRQNNAVRTKKLNVSTQWDKQAKDSQYDELMRNMNSLLNKLTREKFNIITDALVQKKSEMKSLVALRGVVDLVFEKAVMAPNYALMFADLCYVLQNQYPNFTETIKKPDGKDQDVMMDFRRVLLDKCKAEFESKNQIPAQNKPLDEEQEFRRRERKVGNIKFIGELFRNNILNEKIIHVVIRNMLELDKPTIPELENIELTVKLLTTIGQLLDQGSTESSENNKKYFNKLKMMAEDKERVEPRMRFLIRDLIDLRESNWQSKKNDLGPKTLREIQQDVRQQQIDKNNEALRVEREQLSYSSNIPRSPESSRNRGGRGAPSQSYGRHPESPQKDNPLSKSTGWLASPDDKRGRSNGGRNFAKETTLSPKSKRKEVANQRNYVPKQERSPVKAAESKPISREPVVRALNFDDNKISEVISIISTPNLSAPQTIIPLTISEPPNEKKKDDKEIEKPIIMFLEEYRNSEDIDDACVCFKKIVEDRAGLLTVKKAVNMAFFGKDRDRRIYVELLKGFSSKHKVLKEEDFKQGLSMVSQSIEDTALDLPFAKKYFANILSTFLIENIISTPILAEILKQTEESASLAEEVLKSVTKEKGEVEAKRLASEPDMAAVLNTHDKKVDENERTTNDAE